MSRNDDIDIGSLGGTNYQRICDHLRADILDQRFEMGTRLKIAELAARYKVSQMPVREYAICIRWRATSQAGCIMS